MTFDNLLWALLVCVFIYILHHRRKHKTQLAFIENYDFHPAIGNKVKDHYPHLTEEQIELVMRALKDYFYVCHQAKRRVVAMPSQVVDVAWHEFILFTRAYQQFCQNALGRFLHHTPTEAMKSQCKAQEGIKRAWRLSCAKSGISPSAPTALPLLFEIDTKLAVEDGFKYAIDCKNRKSPAYGDGYCASHIRCTSGCSGDSGSSSGGSDSSCSSGCGGD